MSYRAFFFSLLLRLPTQQQVGMLLPVCRRVLKMSVCGSILRIDMDVTFSRCGCWLRVTYRDVRGFGIPLPFCWLGRRCGPRVSLLLRHLLELRDVLRLGILLALALKLAPRVPLGAGLKLHRPGLGAGHVSLSGLLEQGVELQLDVSVELHGPVLGK